MKKIKIGSRFIGDGEPAYIIAEIGVNHNGSLDLAVKTIDEAKKAGADAVKFQCFQTEALASRDAGLAEYQKRSGKNNQTEMLKSLELTKEEFRLLNDYCLKQSIDFLATPFDMESAVFLHELGMTAFKVSSGDVTNYPLLRTLKTFQKPILLSTGMSTLAEMKKIIRDVELLDAPLVLLHCTSAYPAPYEHLHLRAIRSLEKEFPAIIGYSDHSIGIEVPIASVALGYKVIEKHFTLSKKLPGPDHPVSLEKEEFQRMVESIRRVEAALGSIEKKITKPEWETRRLTRRSLYAAKDLPMEHTLTKEDVAILRPLAFIEASDYDHVVGKTLRKNKRKGESFQWTDFEDEVSP